ncbi:bromodomain-containing protein 8-like isoform X2 [Lineus longissimus]|uniref:bromodomain-containing protein 8-like isoform X2 n=1 Tax=Lineus longissimus TaxID=88925 RepID=UPI00315CB728
MAATPQRFKLKHQAPLDVWSLRERLSLACSVMRSGDQNWVSVSRAIKPFGERDRPNDWFSQKNCALQYSELLEKVETPKRKRGDRGEIETPGNQIVRNLTIERIEELKRLVQEDQQKYKKIKREVEAVESGQCDDRIKEMWDDCVAQRKAEEEARVASKKKCEEESAARALVLAAQKTNKPLIPGLKSPKKKESKLKLSINQRPNFSESEDTQDSVISEGTNVDVITDEEQPSSALAAALTSVPPMLATPGQDKSKTSPPSSPVLSSLLKCKYQFPDSQNIKAEQSESRLKDEKPEPVKSSLEVAATKPELPTSPTAGAPTLSKLLGTPPTTPCKSTTTHMAAAVSQPIKEENKKQLSSPSAPVAAPAKTSIVAQDQDEELEDTTLDVTASEVDMETDKQVDTIVDPPSPDGDSEVIDTSSVFPDDISEAIKNEPPSPTSSVSSRVSDVAARKQSRNSSKGSRRGSTRVTRTTRSSAAADDDEGIKEHRKDSLDEDRSVHDKLGPGLRLDLDISDEETVPESDDASLSTPKLSVTLFSESIPNSPASMSQCSDTEDEKAYRTWKKSIMLVWRAAANHKFANVFLHPVTEDIAPGYKSVVLRPMDLSLIKKNIDSGQIRTTTEFQHDMMLMFTNAIMYNNSNQSVYNMATTMYDDVMQQIEQYVHTQLMLQSAEGKILRTSRRSDASDKEDDVKRRRISMEHESGGKSKRRKTRADD